MQNVSTALYRLPAGLADETLRARAADHDASLWFQRVPLASADADLWRDRELRRGTAGAARFVVLSYVDGVRELVVTTPVPDPAPLAPLPETAADRDPLTHLAGASEPSTVDLGPADPADVLAALGLVFSRYTRSATLAFGVPGGATLVTVDEDQPVGVFRKQVATAPAGATRDVPTVGVVADEQPEPQPIRVVPCTPYPLTVHVTGGNATAWFAGNGRRAVGRGPARTPPHRRARGAADRQPRPAARRHHPRRGPRTAAGDRREPAHHHRRLRRAGHPAWGRARGVR